MSITYGTWEAEVLDEEGGHEGAHPHLPGVVVHHYPEVPVDSNQV